MLLSLLVIKNKHAFVRNNANFMFANKRLYLPSVNEIKNSIYKNVKKKMLFLRAFQENKIFIILE